MVVFEVLKEDRQNGILEKLFRKQVKIVYQIILKERFKLIVFLDIIFDNSVDFGICSENVVLEKNYIKLGKGSIVD